MIGARIISRSFMAGASAAALLACALPAYATPQFDRLVAESKAAMMADPQTALQHATAALADARGSGQPVQVATAQWLQGEALIRLNRIDEAAPAIRSGLAAVAARAPDTKLHGDLTMAEGEVLAIGGQVEPALEHFQAAFRIFGAAREPRSQAMALQNIGSIYQDAGDYAKVHAYYAQSAELYPGDPALLLSARNNIGNALKAQGKYDAAIAEFHQALTVARSMKSRIIQASVLENLASTEVLAGRIDAAQTDLQAGLAIARKDAAEELPYLWGVAAQVAQKRGQLHEAAQDVERAFAGSDLSKTDLLFRDFHRTAYEIYSALGDDHRALQHLSAYKRLDDDAKALAASTNAALAAAQFDFANQASRIAKLKAGQLQRDVELARTRAAITGLLLLGAMVVSGLLAVGMLAIRRSRNEVRAANGQLNVANDQLEKALAARTEFLATTSHEIRTPLNGILGMTEVLLREPKLDAPLREKIAVVHGAGETMRALVDDILDVAKIETGKLVINRAEMSLALLFRETGHLWTARAQAKGLSLVMDVDGAPERIVEDAARLRQILFNLMSNAIKFTEAGSVTLSAKVEALEEGEQLLLRVVDTGIGIPRDRQGEIFESFSQVDGSTSRVYGGTGLGLTICRSLAVAMGGGIVVESELGQGSAFEVRLPLERLDTDAPVAIETPAESFADSRLLLVDANPLSQAVVRTVLSPKVRAVETASDIATAAAAAAQARFDLVLLEGAVLPEVPAARFHAARELAEAVEPAPLVLVVAGLKDEDAGPLLAAGVAQIIRKPIAAPALVAELAAGFAARLRVAATSQTAATS